MKNIENTANKILNSLGAAFGGYSQISNAVIGQAVAGNVNNSGLSPDDAFDVITHIQESLREEFGYESSDEYVAESYRVYRNEINILSLK